MPVDTLTWCWFKFARNASFSIFFSANHLSSSANHKHDFVMTRLYSLFFSANHGCFLFLFFLFEADNFEIVHCTMLNVIQTLQKCPPKMLLSCAIQVLSHTINNSKKLVSLQAWLTLPFLVSRYAVWCGLTCGSIFPFSFLFKHSFKHSRNIPASLH